MTSYAAFLRGVNVGGHGRLAMRDLAALCGDAGCRNVRTCIQSGNVALTSDRSERAIKKALEDALTEVLGKPAAVMVRTSAELESVVARNPFPDAEPSKLLVLFLDEPPPRTRFAGLATPGGESVQPDGREVFVHYPDGMGRSRLKLPFAETGTGRNLNTLRKLLAMTKESG